MLAGMLLEMSQSITNADSLKLGRGLVTELKPVGKMHPRGTVEHAGFAMYSRPDIPSALVETAFISNPEEELKLRSAAHQIETWHGPSGGGIPTISGDAADAGVK